MILRNVAKFMRHQTMIDRFCALLTAWSFILTVWRSYFQFYHWRDINLSMRQTILKQHKPGSPRHIRGSLKSHKVYSFKRKTLHSLHGHISTVIFDLLLAAILT